MPEPEQDRGRRRPTCTAISIIFSCMQRTPDRGSAAKPRDFDRTPRSHRIASHRSSAQGQNRRAWRPNGAHQRPVDRQAQSELQSFASFVPNSCPWISECACSSCCRAIDADNSFFFFKYPGLFIYIRDTIDSFGHKRLNDAGR